MRALGTAVVCLLIVAATISAQPTADWRFQWQTGQFLYYRVEHTTDVAEVVGGNKVETKSKVNLVKRWEVASVDAQGTATLKMSITVMRNEQTKPNGEVAMFDSRTPDKSTPELREQLGKFIGQTLAVIRVDKQGHVVEVKEGASNRYEAEPPFALVLPAAPVQPGQSWNRDYAITLDPPQGGAGKHAAKQKLVCTALNGGLATISLTTQLAKLPDNKAEQMPLVQKMPEGEIVFDLQRGRLHSARLVIDREIVGHQGEGSSYRFQSTYSEQYAE